MRKKPNNYLGGGGRGRQVRDYLGDEEFIPIQALTIKTHFLLGVSLTLAFLYAAW